MDSRFMFEHGGDATPTRTESKHFSYQEQEFSVLPSRPLPSFLATAASDAYAIMFVVSCNTLLDGCYFSPTSAGEKEISKIIY